MEKPKKSSAKTDVSRIQPYDGGILKEIHLLSGKETLDRILEHHAPQQLVRRMPSQDFFWLIQEVEEEASLQLLKFASLKQWQYLLDLELWRGDRLEITEAFQWLRRLLLSDPRRLVRWLFAEGQTFCYYYFYKSVQVEIKEGDEVYDVKDEFITLDGLYYIRIPERDQKETTEGILRKMADEDLPRYQSLLLGLAGVIPAELEEEMYRLRNVRLAEHGFLPREEALLVYSPLKPDALVGKEKEEKVVPMVDQETLDLAPYSAFHYAKSKNLLSKAALRITDARFSDRIRLEFAGLCNQILSADGPQVNDLDVLKKTCRKAAGYLNLVLEKTCSKDISAAEALLKQNSLISLFRTGFGLAQELKWEAERWLKVCWFSHNGLDYGFWGDEWGNTLAGLVAKRPQYYDGREGGEYRDFEYLSDLTAAHGILHHLIVLDRLLANLTGTSPLTKKVAQTPGLAVHSLLFTLWARQMLDLKPSLEGISLKQTKRFFRLLRAGDKSPPYQMLGFEEAFVKGFMAAAPGFDTREAATLKDTLSLLWQEFCQEYERVRIDALDARFSKYILIRAR